MERKLRLLERLNAANPDLYKPLSLDNVAISLPSEDTSAGGSTNTSIDVLALPEEGFTGEVSVFYQRMNIKDFVTEEFGDLRTRNLASYQAVIDQINAKYKMDLKLTEMSDPTLPEFPSLEQTERVTFEISGTALGWYGTVDFDITHGNPLFETEITINVLQVFDHPTDPTQIGDKLSGPLLTWGRDFTAFKDRLMIDPVTGYWMNFDDVLDIGNMLSIPGWYNGTVVDLPTSSVPIANQNFERVKIQTVVSDGNLIGPLYFHYDNEW